MQQSNPRNPAQTVASVFMWAWILLMLGIYLQTFAGPIGLVLNTLSKIL